MNIVVENQVLKAEKERLTAALFAEQKATEAAREENRRLRSGIQSATLALAEPENTEDTVWFDAHTTLLEHLLMLLDPGPAARGERPLLPEAV